MRHGLHILVMLLLTAAGASAQSLDLHSPDKQIALQFAVTDAGVPQYSVTYRGRQVIADAPLGLTLDGKTPALKLTAAGSLAEHDASWKMVCGQWSAIHTSYTEVTEQLAEVGAPDHHINITLRVYNEGVAFRYTIPKTPGADKVHITAENSAFAFTADHPAWAVYSAQGRYEQVPLSRIKPGCERPLVVKVADDCYAAIGEANLVDYARMKLAPLAGHDDTLVSHLDGDVNAPLPLTTPWRLIMLGRSPGELLDHSYMVKALCEPCAIDDTSWIKPGKMIREVTLTTAGGKACVVFAAAHHLQYILFDAGWYGPEGSPASDATTVTLDARRSHGPLDLHEVIRYANAHGVGVFLYVNHIALEKQLDTILPLYEKWGVKGVKYGFVNVGPQKWTSWLHEAVRKAAAHHLLVDIHDEYRPTGYSRTYPNLLTQEGIGGDETSPLANQTLTLAFTRMLAGAADSTYCYYSPRVDKIANHAYQLAKTVVLYSPLQSLYWYDRPAAGSKPSGMDRIIGDEPELEFFDDVPTVWDDTRTLDGAIGQYAVVARRSGSDWYIGAMTADIGDKPRTFTIKLDMLPAGHPYIASLYINDPTVKTRTHVRIDRRNVDHNTTLKITLSARDGEAIHLTPAGETDRRLQAEGKGWRLQLATVADPHRPRVLLIGDSIVNAYAGSVIAGLKGKAYVDAWVNPYCQGSYHLDQMVRDVLAHGPYDVIHFNMGLHGWQKGRIPEGQFIPLTQKLVDTLREAAPHAKLIWASSTPVTVKGHPDQINTEINPIIEQQNTDAATVMHKNHIPIDDLYGLMRPHINLARGDMFHWTGPGVKMQTQAVVTSIESALNDKSNP